MSALIPDWINQMKEADDKLAREEEARKHKVAAATMTLKTEGPEFWNSFLKELKVSLDALSEIGVRAVINNAGDPGGNSYYISMNYGTVPVRTATLTVMYLQGNINLYDQSGNISKVWLTVDDQSSEIIGIMNGTGPVKPPELAKEILRPIVNRLRL